MSQRPTTPQREKPTEYRLSISSNPSSRRSSFGNTAREQNVSNQTMLDKYFLPQLQELTDSMTTLDGNMTHMNFIHESITDLNESLSSLLYGLMCNSWCVDFPKISHDTPHELQVLHKLRQLNKEKELLLSKLRPAELLKQTQSSTPSLRDVPNTQYGRVRQTPREHGGGNEEEEREDDGEEEEDDDDDDNTAASFVSNPTNMAFHSMSQQHSANSNPQSSLAQSKLRRRSILHQIRSNAASSSTPMEKKHSLAISAQRIPIKQSSRPAAGAVSSSVRPKSKSMSSRPPFR